MEKIKRFFRNLSEKRIYQVIFFVISMSVIFSGYFIAREKISKMLEICEDDFLWVYQVDSAEIQKGELVLSGFAFNTAIDAVGNNYEIILREIGTEKLYFLEMEYSERQDVNDYFLCKNNYLRSGFCAKIKEKKINLYEEDYEVLLRIKKKKTAYKTEIYLNNGKLMYTNPKEFVPLDIKGTELEKIVGNGMLRVYRPDYGMYVYQYEGYLYWIVEPDYDFINGDIYVQCQLNTTQPAKLPKERLMNEWYWDNIGFMFKSNELIEVETGKYRVAKVKIPQEYSITYIWTGNYIEDWIWKQNFRPIYFFE